MYENKYTDSARYSEVGVNYINDYFFSQVAYSSISRIPDSTF